VLRPEVVVAVGVLLALIAAPVQLVMGAQSVPVVLALWAAAMGLIAFFGPGAGNLGGWVAIFYSAGNILVALYAKTILGQPIDSNLAAPVDSFLAVAITATAILASLALVTKISVGRAVLKNSTDATFLARLSWSCFVLGATFWLVNRWTLGPSGSGFGGVTLFRDLLLMAVIARTAMILQLTEDERSIDGLLVLIIGASAVLGLVDNSKTVAALPVVSYFATVIFFRGGFPISAIAPAAGAALIFVVIVAPVVHGLRALGQQSLGLSDRIALMVSNTTLEMAVFRSLASDQFRLGYYDYFGGDGRGQMLVGRYASIQQIDPIIAAVNGRGPMGGEAMWPGLVRLVPSVLNPEKPREIESYYTLQYYGLVGFEGGRFPTLPLAGQAYAAYGLTGVLTIPFFTFLGLFLVLKKLGWMLSRNIYSVFIFCQFVIVYSNQGDFGQYAAASLRNLPLYTAVFLSISFVFEPGNRRRSVLPRIPADAPLAPNRVPKARRLWAGVRQGESGRKDL
jgi:hypothetical protein